MELLMAAITNKELHSEVDQVFSDFLRLLAKESPVAARASQGHCVAVLNLIQERLRDEPAPAESTGG